VQNTRLVYQTPLFVFWNIRRWAVEILCRVLGWPFATDHLNKDVLSRNGDISSQMVTNEDELLKILQAHGEQFLGSFSLPQQTCNSRKRKRNPEIDSTQEKSWTLAVDENEDDDEEWKGIIGHSGVNTDKDLDLRLEMEGGMVLSFGALKHSLTASRTRT